MTDHVRSDEAAAGVIALVAEDAVQLQRVADAFVDLKHHLRGHQQHVGGSRRALRRLQQRQRLAHDALGVIGKADDLELLESALPGDMTLAVGSMLTLGTVSRHHRQSGAQVAVRLLDARAGAGEQQAVAVRGVDGGGPVDDLIRRPGFVRGALERPARFYRQR